MTSAGRMSKLSFFYGHGRIHEAQDIMVDGRSRKIDPLCRALRRHQIAITSKGDVRSDRLEDRAT
jgi:hypothetical protein